MAVDPNKPPSLGGGKQSALEDLIGVPDGYTVPANDADFFKPGGFTDRAIAGPGLASLLTPTNKPHLPTYHDGSEQAVSRLAPEVLARLQARMAAVGLIAKSAKITVGVADDTTIAAYKKLLGVANRYAITDDEALDFLHRNPQVKGTGTGLEAAATGDVSQARTVKRTDRSVTEYTALDAESAADQAFQEALGQDAKPHEARALRAALNAYAEAHPSITNSTSKYDADGNLTNTSSHTSGGMDAAGAQQIAQNQARANPDYAEVQAASTFFPLLEQALGATADVG